MLRILAAFSVTLSLASCPSMLAAELPDAPSQVAANAVVAGTVSGAVIDSEGAQIAGATVALQAASRLPVKVRTANDGSFTLTGVRPGTYQITVSYPGFTPTVQTDIALQAGQSLQLPRLVLKVATVVTEVTAMTERELAIEQVKIQEKQRVLGVIPDFFTTYEKHPAPLSTGQKYHMTFRVLSDPTTFGFAALGAGIEQNTGAFPDYGYGAQGYGKRFGAALANTYTAIAFGGAIYPSLFHQDPRYFYMGTGTVKRRLWHAFGSGFRSPSDKGKWQPNYSFILANFTAGAISNAYYPAANRGAALTCYNALLATASGAVGAIVEEFFISRIVKGKPTKDPARPETPRKK